MNAILLMLAMALLLAGCTLPTRTFTFVAPTAQASAAMNDCIQTLNFTENQTGTIDLRVTCSPLEMGSPGQDGVVPVNYSCISTCVILDEGKFVTANESASKVKCGISISPEALNASIEHGCYRVGSDAPYGAYMWCCPIGDE